MNKQIESIVLQNSKKQRLRIYAMIDNNTFCIGLDGEEDHFEFKDTDADEIIEALRTIVDVLA